MYGPGRGHGSRVEGMVPEGVTLPVNRLTDSCKNNYKESR